MQTAGGASLNASDSAPSSDRNSLRAKHRHESDDPASGSKVHPKRRLRFFAVFVVLAYLADLSTKLIVVEQLPGRAPVTLVPEFLQLTFVRNAGAAFGIATGFTAVLSAVALVVCVVVVRLASKLRDRVWAAALGLLLGGALGNLTDRIFREPGVMKGHVVDFLQFVHFPFIDFPVFNIADTCISVAAVLIVVQSFRGIGVDGSRVAADEPTDVTVPDDTRPDPHD